MPLAIDPLQTFDLTLEDEKNKDNSAKFTFRYLTGREWIKVSKQFQEALKQEDPEQGLNGLKEILGLTFVKWVMKDKEGKDIPSTIADIDLYLTMPEIRELVSSVFGENSLTPSEKKRLELQSTTNTDGSASAQTTS